MAAGKRKRSREATRDAIPSLFRRRGWWGADFRRWGKGRITLRDPESPTWPAGGERTASREVAGRWVLRYLDAFREEDRRRQLKIGPVPKRLGAAANAWLATRKRTQALNTWQANRTALRHLREQLGEDLLTDRLSTPVLQEFFDALHEDYMPNTLRAYREAISGFLRWLGQEGKNAALSVTLPKVVHEEVATWQLDELEVLRAAADELDQDPALGVAPRVAGRVSPFRQFRLSLELALACGARRHELFALRWEQIRPAAKTVRITHQLGVESRSLVPLKGKNARTALVLPSWWEFHREGAKGFIFTDPAGGLVAPTQLEKIRRRLLEHAELYRPGVGWHVDRHTYARDFVVEGGRYQELQRSLGHKSIVTTEQLYGHFGEDVAAELARRRIYREDPLRVVR